MIERMDHVGIVVDDLAAAIEFFVELDVVDGIPDEYLEASGTYEMTPEQRVDWEAEVAFALRRHGPDRRDPDMGEADRLRDDLPSAIEELARQRDERQRA